MRGKTEVCVFDGVMDAPLYIDILDLLDRTLIPVLQIVFCNEYRFMQDNDPKHTSRAARSYHITQSINWWPTPAESPDINSIENIWHELKEFIQHEVKSTTKSELVNGIIQFWHTVTDENAVNHSPGSIGEGPPGLTEVAGLHWPQGVWPSVWPRLTPHCASFSSPCSSALPPPSQHRLGRRHVLGPL